jgi:hypothetical protein
MKEYRVEFLFVGFIILGLAVWKMSELVKTRCEQKQIREGLSNKNTTTTAKPPPSAPAAPAAKPPSAPAGGSPDPATQKVLTEAKKIIDKKKTEPLSTEQFTTYTSQHEMTIHQRQKAATALDTGVGLHILPVPIVNDTIAETAAPVSSSIKEGMENENPDADSKEIIDRNLTSINANDSQSKFKLRDYYIKAAYNAFNPDKFKNSNVSMDALLYVIARGCRFIDFEVFSVETSL